MRHRFTRRGEDVSVTSRPVTAKTTLTVAMAPGGGFAARIHP